VLHFANRQDIRHTEVPSEEFFLASALARRQNRFEDFHALPAVVELPLTAFFEQPDENVLEFLASKAFRDDAVGAFPLEDIATFDKDTSDVVDAGGDLLVAALVGDVRLKVRGEILGVSVGNSKNYSGKFQEFPENFSFQPFETQTHLKFVAKTSSR
jgi:hypothetical protein